MAGTVVKPATEVKHRRDQIRRPDHTQRVRRTRSSLLTSRTVRGCHTMFGSPFKSRVA
jgi:hypothetical protein